MNFLKVNQSRLFSTALLYDVAVIGGGPGGYVTAIRAAQNGLKTVCIEKRGTLGGTCLNAGCIPSKILLNISHKFQDVQKTFPGLGIRVDNSSINLTQSQIYKDKTIKSLTTGIEGLFKMNKVDYIKGEAKLKDNSSVEVKQLAGDISTVNAKNIVIATGSETASVPNLNIVPDENIILTSTGALNIKTAPKKLVIIGAGVIGLELGSVYKRVGTEVIIVEFMNRIVPAFDNEVAKELQKLLTKQGIKFMLSSNVTDVQVIDNGAKVYIESRSDKKTNILDCDKVLLAVGRKPYTQNLGLDHLNIEKNKNGQIVIDEHFRVLNHKNIYAIGDVIPGPMLAHKAEEEGIAVADIIANQKGHVNYNAIPSVIYTTPEVAGVGNAEEDLKIKKIQYKRGFFPFAANSRARVNDEVEGFVKILTDKTTNSILGAWIIGPSAGELIHELVLAIQCGLSSEVISKTCHAHPALSEAIKEACLSSYRKPIHFK